MTAIRTRSLHMEVSNTIDMDKPLTIAASTCKPRLIYAVPTFRSISETFTPVLQQVKQDCTSMVRLISYWHRYEHCSDLYLFFKNGQGKGFTDPVDAPDLSRFQMVAM